MKNKYMYIIALLTIILVSSSTLGLSNNIDYTAKHVENEIIVKFKESTNVLNENNAKNKIQEIYKKSRVVESKQLMKYTVDNTLGLTRIYKIKFVKNSNIKDIIDTLNKNNQIEFAEPNYILELTLGPNDQFFWRQWHLNNTGQCYNPPTCSVRTADSDIDALEAWDIETGSSDVVIAVVDSGLNMHVDILGNVWENTLEVNGITGVDDDNNTFIDDYNGWNFVNNNNTLYDTLNHGTPASGVIAARTNNSIGVAGICWNCKIMMPKVSTYQFFPMDWAIPGINYAINEGADIITMSFAFSSHSSAFDDIINTANNNDIFMVAGAGNNNFTTPLYPAAYPQVLAAAGTQATDQKWSLSNFGSWINISAPARDLYTIRLLNSYGGFTGTSAASPVVAGVAALLLSKDPSLTKAQLEQILLSTCDNIDVMNQAYVGMLGCGRINAYRALIGIPGTLLDVEAHDGYVSGQSDLTPGGRVIIGLKVTNNLDIPLYEVSVKLDTDSPDPDREFEIYRLGPGETTNVNLHWSYQNAGTYHPFVIVDNNNIFTETDENNNRIDLNVVIAEPLKPNQNEVAT